MHNAPLAFEIKNFSLGWDNVSGPTTLSKGTFKDIKNFNITGRGLEKRGGITKLYSTPAIADKKIAELYEYNAPDKNSYLLTAVDTKVKAFIEGVWTELKANLTANKRLSFATHLGLCYAANGVDENFKLYNKTAYQLGIDPPVTAPGIQVISSGQDTKAEEYPSSNQDHCGELGATSGQALLAQAFQLDYSAELTKIALKLKKIGSPTGNLWVEIHSSTSGTSTTKNTSTYIVGQGTANLDVSTITGSFVTYDFPFTGTKPQLSKNTNYYLVVYRDFAINAGNYVLVGFDNSAPGYDTGKTYWEINGSLAWTSYSAVDLVFEVYGHINEIIEWRDPTAVENYGTGQTWANPTNVYASDDIKATCYLPKGGGSVSKQLRATNLGFDLPASATVVGIEARIERSRNSAEGVTDYSIRILKGGVESGDEKASADIWPTADAYKAYGGAAVLWGLTWTREDINSTNFGISISAAGGTVTTATFAYIDHIQIKVYYTTTETPLATWPFGNLDDIKGLGETTSQTLVAQGFSTSLESTVTRVKLYLAKVGSPTGNVWVEIHSFQQGTSASKGVSEYIVGEASANVDVASLSAFPTYGWKEFTFSGTKPSLQQGVTYYLVVYGDFTASSVNYVRVGEDKIAPSYDDGSRWDINGSMAWVVNNYIDLIFELYMTVGGITGDFKYKYCYKRTVFKDLMGNPSGASVLAQPANQNVRVSMVASLDPQVGKMLLYRTHNGGEDFFKAVELSNATQDYDDALTDNDLTTSMEDDNSRPPKSKFVITHKDRVYYANCPDEESGGALVRWSKSGKGEACPLINYQYFDRDDGKDITGIASLRANFLVFKSNKIGVLSGDPSQPSSCEIHYLSQGIGAIASWAILPLEDKVIFLSEEGWKATDGTDIYDLSPKINRLIADGYITINENENYSIAYYPKKSQFQFLINHSTLDPMVVVGHLLVPLMLASKGIIGISEKALGDMVGWTRHEYDYHVLTCLANYTDSSGITRIVAGSNNGYVYLLDSGASDDEHDIQINLVTDWLNLDRPQNHTKITRKGCLSYCTDGTINLELKEDRDFKLTGDLTTFTGAGRGIDDAVNESFDLAGSGELFRYTFSEVGSQKLNINSLLIWLRDLGIRK